MVKVTWALVRLGLLAVRLRADFVVTEAMVVFGLDGVAATGRGFTGRQPFTIHKVGSVWGGQPARSPVAGRSQTTLGRVAGP